MARNQYAGICYRCGLMVEAGTGYFEKIKGGPGWRVQHAYFGSRGGVRCADAKCKETSRGPSFHGPGESRSGPAPGVGQSYPPEFKP